MINKSFSLCDSNREQLDLKLDKIFKEKQNGVYIELGANDGLTQNNTAFFEFTRNWTGLLIEPSMGGYNLCCQNRPNSICVNMCCVSDDYKESSVKGDFNSNLMSSVNGIRLNSQNLVEVECSTLSKLIEIKLEDKSIDLLSLDTEGYELNILNGLNLNKHRPKFMLIEIYTNDYDSIVEYLLNNNYKLHSSFSNYNKIDNPMWDGTHNDFLFYDSLDQQLVF